MSRSRASFAPVVSDIGASCKYLPLTGTAQNNSADFSKNAKFAQQHIVEFVLYRILSSIVRVRIRIRLVEPPRYGPAL